MANDELKQRQSVMWANGPYEKALFGDGPVLQHRAYILVTGTRR
jgi:hypothetical protein